MDGGRRSSFSSSSSSTALLLLLALMLAASTTTTTAAAAAQQRYRQQPPAVRSYKLITVMTYLGDRCKLAMRTDDSSIAGFANNRNDWFAVHGTEGLLEPYLNKQYGGGGGEIPGHGLVGLLGALVKKNNATS